jgi:histone H4
MTQNTLLPRAPGSGYTDAPRRIAKPRTADTIIQGALNRPTIRRLARRGGIKRINSISIDETRSALKIFLTKIIGDSVEFTKHARRSTVIQNDVLYALKRNGKILYGFD